MLNIYAILIYGQFLRSIHDDNVCSLVEGYLNGVVVVYCYVCIESGTRRGIWRRNGD